MPLTASIIETARSIARDETGADDPEVVMVVLARMVAVASHGVCAGFLRLAPGEPVQLDLHQRGPIE